MAALRSKIESALAASLAGAAENIYKGFDYNDKVLRRHYLELRKYLKTTQGLRAADIRRRIRLH